MNKTNLVIIELLALEKFPSFAAFVCVCVYVYVCVNNMLTEKLGGKLN